MFCHTATAMSLFIISNAVDWLSSIWSKLLACLIQRIIVTGRNASQNQIRPLTCMLNVRLKKVSIWLKIIPDVLSMWFSFLSILLPLLYHGNVMSQWCTNAVLLESCLSSDTFKVIKLFFNCRMRPGIIHSKDWECVWLPHGWLYATSQGPCYTVVLTSELIENRT